MALKDSGIKYGSVTRALHWGMAGLMSWQFLGMAIKLSVGKAPITAFFVGTHKSVGVLLLALVAIRAVWGIYNLKLRPTHGPGFWGKASLFGHLALYGLMLVVPSLALLRQYGSGKPLDVFGLRVIEGGWAEIGWMTAPANAVHGILGWTLLAAIIGHIVMALVHQLVWKDVTLKRMTH